MELANKIFSRFFGKKVGEDEFGNIFYESKKLSRYFGRYMRWVSYNGIPEPTKVSAEWYSWLHHQENKAPLGEESIKHKLGKSRNLNLTGSKFSYFPPGHFLSKSKTKPKSTGDYTAWVPK
ncbi:NADH-ubiquinone oxidoreductase subunit NDUFA12 family protein [Candidatus Bandiella numerosa]|uniref:NADH-ubiquinone oxidoreductase subunit NDUFA12 family protein n=1 Tax=Candidatus Bandiella numerosa TaxID=2570586 RepID=UPI001EFFF95B|nr:NADH-ubiquinone oxidoreductase subunit NDUFA12 family protein [Candidatus Bandiella numerosa]